MPVTPRDHWYDQNVENGYPLDPVATRVDDLGASFENGVLVDLQLRYPRALGQYAFLGAASVGPGLVTLAILAADALDATTGSLLAVLTAGRPLTDRRMLALTPRQPGVSGWAALGSAATDTALRVHRFSTPAQSLLLPRAARAYGPLPVEAVKSRSAGRWMDGLVRLSPVPPLTITKQTRVIDGQPRNCVVFGLAEPQGDEFANADSSVFEGLAGACAARAESGNCPDPQPVETIARVPPDCDGQITIEFRGCAQVFPFAGGSGLVVDCDATRDQSCPAPYIPDDDGTLPDEYAPDLPGETTTTTTTSTIPPDGSEGPPPELPIVTCARDGVLDLTSAFGVFNFLEFESPYAGLYCVESDDPDLGFVYVSRSRSFFNLATRDPDEAIVGRRVRAQFYLPSTGLGSRHNGGVAVNARPSTADPTRTVFYAAVADYESQTFKLVRFNGVSFATLASVFYPGLPLDTWLEAYIDITEGFGGACDLACVLTEPGGTVLASLPPVSSAAYRPSSGTYGFFADAAETYFSVLSYEEIP